MYPDFQSFLEMDEKGNKIYLEIKQILKEKQEENDALDRLIRAIIDRPKEKSGTQTTGDHLPFSHSRLLAKRSKEKPGK